MRRRPNVRPAVFARAWLKDKSPFALPALYHPESLIPLDVWKASPPSSNGNEQSHRGVNRDGVNLTILGGIMRGWQYDRRAFRSLELHADQGIYTRDSASTHFYRFGRSVDRAVAVQRRTAHRELDLTSAAQNGSASRRTDPPTPPSEITYTSEWDVSDSLYGGHEPGVQDDEAQVWPEAAVFEPSCTVITPYNYGGIEGAQDDEPEIWAEAAAVEQLYAAVQYPHSYYSELAGALDMTPNTSQAAPRYEPAVEAYTQQQPVLGQENLIQHTFSEAAATSFIPYDPNIHRSSFSTLEDALTESMITYCD